MALLILNEGQNENKLENKKVIFLSVEKLEMFLNKGLSHKMESAFIFRLKKVLQSYNSGKYWIDKNSKTPRNPRQ